MSKTFITKKHQKAKNTSEHNKNTHKTLEKFYSVEQKKKEEILSVEEQIFEHLKNHTKKVLEKKKTN